MAKKNRKKNFFNRAVSISNKYFKDIFEDIIKTAKSNSDVDLNLVEPDFKKIILEIQEEIKKDKEGAKLKKDEIKGIISNSFNNLKEAIKNDRNNGLDDDTKDAWVKELEDLGLASIFDQIEEDDEIDLDDSFGEESLYEDADAYIKEDHKLSTEDIVKASDGALLVLGGIKEPTFISFLTLNKDKVQEILCHNLCNNVDTPIHVEECDKVTVDTNVNLSMDLLHKYMSMEEGMIVDEDEEIIYPNDEESHPLDDEVIEAMPEPEMEEVKVELNGVMTEDVLEEYKKIIQEDEAGVELLRNLRSHISDKDRDIVDTAIWMIMKIYELYVKMSGDTTADSFDKNDFISFYMSSKALPMYDIAKCLGDDRTFTTLEIALIVLLELPILEA